MRYLMYMCDHCGYAEVDWEQEHGTVVPPQTVVRYCAVCQALRTMVLVSEGDSIPPDFNNLITKEKLR